MAFFRSWLRTVLVRRGLARIYTNLTNKKTAEKALFLVILREASCPELVEGKAAEGPQSRLTALSTVEGASLILIFSF